MRSRAAEVLAALTSAAGLLADLPQSEPEGGDEESDASSAEEEGTGAEESDSGAVDGSDAPEEGGVD